MKIAFTIVASCTWALLAGAEEPGRDGHLEAAAFYSYSSTNIGGIANPGDTVNISIAVRNLSTNTVSSSRGKHCR